jgi:ubiquinone biosynthesis accessory factor UbiK
MESNFIDDLAKRLSASLPSGIPSGLANLRADVEANFRSVLQSALAKLDLVTRQEFDVQANVLRRTREKLETLEARLAELQASLAKPPSRSE